ncbi:MAG TPA: Hsp70 family protein [Planctomycetota bacterium]|nr:Hsp70 family protein [Planctomycetota bacterium]
MADTRFVVGIDLGTTNTALAYADLSEKTDHPKIQILEIPQIVRPGSVENRSLLPSFVYLPAESELPAGSLALEWDEKRAYAVGEYARGRGKEVPGRLVSSAKSWLCHPGVDRRSPILPWGAPEDVSKLSPVEVSSRILKHLAEAWDHTVGKGVKGGKLKQQRIMLCVPASFDAAARDLTMEAAHDAGFEDVTLLEEPQAAFYSWLQQHGDAWRKQVKIGDLVLVVDVGGGTTDFSLIAVGEENGSLTLHRIAVGEHILLGGDNMDLALAHTVSARLATEGHKLDNWQLRALAHGCREAKEKMLSTPAKGEPPKEHALAILGRGSSVIGKSIKTRITRDEVTSVILEGFFGKCEPGDRPQKAMRLGLQELGLAYAADPSISKHLAKFLDRENLGDGKELPVKVGGKKFVHPTAILFNGGVMKAPILCERVVEMLNGWLKGDGGEPLRVLPSQDLDLAVARGAAFYAIGQKGKGVRIRGGVARSYYIGVETAMPAVPGHKPPIKALCVVPFGMEEGAEADVPGMDFGVVVGEPVQFRFLSSTTRREDRVGTSIEDWGDSIQELAPIEANLPVTKKMKEGSLVPVKLHSKVTAVGTLELWCQAKDNSGEWKLELNVRE